MTVRIPEELDARLDAIAAAEHVSKHALLLQGARLVADRHGRARQVDEALDFVLAHDAALLERLADA